jgi:hypothetical protein
VGLCSSQTIKVGTPQRMSLPTKKFVMDMIPNYLSFAFVTGILTGIDFVKFRGIRVQAKPL